MSVIYTTSEIVFACHAASCRPPTSGGTGGSNGSGGAGGGGAASPTTYHKGKLFTTDKRLPVGGRKTISEGDLTVSLYRNKDGYHIEGKVKRGVYDSGKYKGQWGKPLHEGDQRQTWVTGGSAKKTLKDAVDTANRLLESHNTERSKAEVAGRRGAQAAASKERVAARDPNAPRRLRESEAKLLSAAISRQMKGGGTFDINKTRLPAHVKAVYAEMAKHPKGSSGHKRAIAEYAPGSVRRAWGV